MERRIFLKSMLGVAGAVAAASVFTSRAEALPLFDELTAMDAAGANPLKAEAAAAEADLPAPGATEAQYYYRRGPYYRRRWARPIYRPYRRCRTFVNRWGRLVRRCF